jgi:hypothetical protein
MVNFLHHNSVYYAILIYIKSSVDVISYVISSLFSFVVLLTHPPPLTSFKSSNAYTKSRRRTVDQVIDINKYRSEHEAPLFGPSIQQDLFLLVPKPDDNTEVESVNVKITYTVTTTYVPCKNLINNVSLDTSDIPFDAKLVMREISKALGCNDSSIEEVYVRRSCGDETEDEYHFSVDGREMFALQSTAGDSIDPYQPYQVVFFSPSDNDRGCQHKRKMFTTYFGKSLPKIYREMQSSVFSSCAVMSGVDIGLVDGHIKCKSLNTASGEYVDCDEHDLKRIYISDVIGDTEPVFKKARVDGARCCVEVAENKNTCALEMPDSPSSPSSIDVKVGGKVKKDRRQHPSEECNFVPVTREEGGEGGEGFQRGRAL